LSQSRERYPEGVAARTIRADPRSFDRSAQRIEWSVDLRSAVAIPRVDAAPIVCAYLRVRTTIELPTPLFRDAKAATAARGTTLKKFFTEAVQRALASPDESLRMERPPVPRGKRRIRARSNREIAELLGTEDLRKAR
jgi:hypothetical protein